MTKDKKKYIESLFYNYKKNIARKKILELGLVTDDDFTLGAIDYSADKIQTSNISNLDNRVIARERELDQLEKDITLAFTFLESLNTKDRYIIESFYIERLKLPKIAVELNYYETKSVWNNKERIITSFMELI